MNESYYRELKVRPYCHSDSDVLDRLCRFALVSWVQVALEDVNAKVARDRELRLRSGSGSSSGWVPALSFNRLHFLLDRMPRY